MRQQVGNKKTVWTVLKYEPGFIVRVNQVFAGEQLIVADCGTHFTIWDKNTFQEIATLKGHTQRIWFIYADHRHIYSASYDQTIKIWDKNTFKEVATFEPPPTNEEPIYVDDQYIYSSLMIWNKGTKVGTMNGIKLWDKKTFEELTTIQMDNEVDSIFTDNQYIYAVYKWHIQSTHQDSNVKVWDKKTFEEVATLGLHFRTKSPLIADDKYIYTGTDDHNAIVWDKETFEEVTTLKGHSKDVSFLDVDEDHIYTGSFHERTVRKWDKKTFEEIKNLENVNCLAIDKKYIYSNYIEGKLQIWDKETFEEVTTLVKNPYWMVSRVADHNNVYTGSYNGELVAWNKNTFQKVLIHKRIPEQSLPRVVRSISKSIDFLFVDDQHIYSANKLSDTVKIFSQHLIVV